MAIVVSHGMGPLWYEPYLCHFVIGQIQFSLYNRVKQRLSFALFIAFININSLVAIFIQ